MSRLQGIKIVTASEMARIEALSIDEGASGSSYMLQAGQRIAEQVQTFISEKGLEKSVTLLIGKGNNGGDAFVAGRYLLQQGYSVSAYAIDTREQSSPLSCQQEEAFQHAGGIVFRDRDPQWKGVLIDGLLGTGFKGQLTGRWEEWITSANQSGCPILSIDIPSGLNGNTGEVHPIAMRATQTIFLGLPKRGFFVGEGPNAIGELVGVDFGIDHTYFNQAATTAVLIQEQSIGNLLPPLHRTRHKYQAGYVVALAGSPGMSGAALLSCLASLRSGAGIVRLFHPVGMEQELMSAPYELICTPYSSDDYAPIDSELHRARALLIGPGVGKTDQVARVVQYISSHCAIPCVIDAEGLFQLHTFPEGAILTPHYGEMCQLLGTQKVTQELCQAFANQHAVTVILKGYPTWIYHPDTDPLVVLRGDPGMATAGTGDVLAGVIAALLAQQVEPLYAALLGVYLHACAGERAAKVKSSYGMIASDLIEQLPNVFIQLYHDGEDHRPSY